jgi:hypothetical protein
MFDIYMRFEIVLLLVSAFLIGNIYTDGKVLRKALSYKKYYQMLGVVVGAFILYYMIKKNPMNGKKILKSTNDYMKYLPIDRDTSNMLAPILDFSSKAMFDENEEVQPNYPVITMQQPVKTTKRSVSETKKKFVASRQNWKCDNCKEQLKASFEVDHIIRLEHGGSNHIDNLVALCRGCHGDKTTIENL